MNPTLELPGITCKFGEITGLLGRNGTGKSRLMKAGFAARPDLSYLPQVNFIPGQLTLKRIFRDFQLNFFEFATRFPEFDARHNQNIARLSGGERRFVENYVIVMSATSFSMLDEPFTHLMPIQVDKIIEVMLEQKGKKGFLITDHLYHYITRIADKLYVLANGRPCLVDTLSGIEQLGYTMPSNPRFPRDKERIPKE